MAEILDATGNRFGPAVSNGSLPRIIVPKVPQLLNSLDDLGNWFCRYDPGGMDSGPLTAWTDASGNGYDLNEFGASDAFIPSVENTFLPSGHNYLDFTPADGCLHELGSSGEKDLEEFDTMTGFVVVWFDDNTGDDMIFGMTNHFSRWATVRIIDFNDWGFDIYRPDNGASGEFARHNSSTPLPSHSWQRIWFRQDASGDVMSLWLNGTKLTDVVYSEVDGTAHIAEDTWINEWSSTLRMEAITMGAKMETDVPPVNTYASDSKICWAGFMEASLSDEAVAAGDLYQKHFLELD